MHRGGIWELSEKFIMKKVYNIYSQEELQTEPQIYFQKNIMTIDFNN